MAIQEKSYSYETLLEDLRATHETSKKKFTHRKHLLSDEDRLFEKFLFSLENDALTRTEGKEEVVHFNFDELMNEISGGEIPHEESDNSHEQESGSLGTGSDRKHTCTFSGCNKSYTSSHGLKYHLIHGHSKDKENVYKPFVCTISKCGKAYRNSNGLKYHMANAHSKSSSGNIIKKQQ
jgi:hypothetical protein